MVMSTTAADTPPQAARPPESAETIIEVPARKSVTLRTLQRFVERGE
jgi:hypothetical protein